MKTAGEILKKTRQKEKLKIDRVAKETKIRSEYLIALEANRFRKLPSSAIARGFIKNYAEFLGLSSEEVLAVFRRDFDEKKAKQAETAESTKLVSKSKFAWTPRLTTLLVLAVFLLLFAAYLIWQYRSLVSAPYY
jgi:cytoskeleton protein RodZ